jgi:hypothetical protein
MKCTPKSCEKCELSEWSEWTNCTRKCKGERKRFRNYFGKNCNKNDTLVQKEECNNCSCVVDGKTYEVSNLIEAII